MSLSQATVVPLQTAESVDDEIEEMYDRITRRAHKIFQDRGGIGAVDLEDWLTAERELVLKPDVFVEEKDDEVIVAVRLGKVNLIDVQLRVTPLVMLIQTRTSETARTVFRTIEFPRRIDTHTAEAWYEDGYLLLTA
jgi:HSP20 family molecular chaperone IbpA